MALETTCYMCEAAATSREHVPPRCLFPESAEMDGEEYRRNLITVPSCDAHNSGKSSDDEFLMVSIAGILGNNSIGYRHKLGKVSRAIRRSSNRLLDKVYLKRRHWVLEVEKNKFLEVIWGTPDLPRLISCFERIAYGLHYNHYRRKFVGRIKVLPAFLVSENKNNQSFIEFVRHKANEELEKHEVKGSNPDVFTYSFGEADAFGLYLLRMRFYEGIEIYCSFQPTEARMPENVVMRLIEGGIETHVKYDNKVYSFNIDEDS